MKDEKKPLKYKLNKNQKLPKPINAKLTRKRAKEKVTLSLYPAQKQRLKELSAKYNMNMSELVSFWIKHQE
jgi:hypothetical protein